MSELRDKLTGKHLQACQFREWECSQPDCGETHSYACTCGLPDLLVALATAEDAACDCRQCKTHGMIILQWEHMQQPMQITICEQMASGTHAKERP